MDKHPPLDRPAGLRRQASVPRAGTGMAAPIATRSPHVRRRANTDTVKLLMLGYRQELAREFTLFNCFGSSFTALSSLTAVGGTYNIGLTYGGPVVMAWGWLVVMLFTTSVGLSMAELASAYPTSGALYYWSFKLAPPRAKKLACWLTAWILTLGQAAFTASNFYTFVYLVSTAVGVQYGVQLSSVQQFGLLVATTAVIGLLNCGSARLTAFMTTLGTMWHIVALAAFCVAVPLLAPQRQSAKYVFTTWQPHSDVTGIDSPVYTTLVGLLMAQWTLTGYDGSAHVAEETLAAETNVPRAILLTVAGVGASGYAFVLALTFVRLEGGVDSLFDPANETGGRNAVLQVLIEVAKGALGGPAGGVALFAIPIVGTFFCSYQSIANNSRMLYAFARDNGVPLSAYAKRVHHRTRAPVYGVLYMLCLTSLLATPMCFNAFVFPAVTSFAVVGCYLAYSLPVLCKLSTGRRYFLAGPFSLGPKLSYANNVVTLAWVGSVTVLFTLPQYYPITVLNLNWSAPILGLALAFSLGWYYLPKYGARHWFLGPQANLGQFNDVLPSELKRKAAEAEAAEAAVAAAALHQASRAVETANSLTRRISGLNAGASGGGGGGGSPPAAAVATVISVTGASGRLYRPVVPTAAAAATPPHRSAAASPADTGTGYHASAETVLQQMRSTPTASGGGGAAASSRSATGLGSPIPAGRERRGATGSGMGLPSLFRSSVAALFTGGGGDAGGRDAPRRSGPKSPTQERHTHTGGGGGGSAAHRRSALSLYDGPLPSGSHIAALLNGVDLTEYDDLVDGGGVDVAVDGRTTAMDARTARQRARRRSLVRRPSFTFSLNLGSNLGLGLGLGRRDQWSGAGASPGSILVLGGGGGGSSGTRDRVSAYSRDRTSLRSRATGDGGGGIGGGGGGDGMGLSGPLLARLQPRFSHELTAGRTASGGAAVGAVGAQRNSDSSVHHAQRARLRRASVSVLGVPPAVAAAERCGGDAAAAAAANGGAGIALRPSLQSGGGGGVGGRGLERTSALLVLGGSSPRQSLSNAAHDPHAAAPPARRRPPLPSPLRRTPGPAVAGVVPAPVGIDGQGDWAISSAEIAVHEARAGGISVYGKLQLSGGGGDDGCAAGGAAGGAGGGGGGHGLLPGGA